MSENLSVRDLACTADDLALLRRFYAEVYAKEFPDPDERESLENMERYLALREAGWYGNNNYRILLALQGHEAVAASIFDFLERTRFGVIEFLVVAGAHREKSIGTRLLELTEKTIEADSLRMTGQPARGIVAEMNDPFLSMANADSLDPFLRCRLWHRWGYRRLEFPYEQPALSADQDPVVNLLLIAKSFDAGSPNSFAPAEIRDTVAEYMRWAMRIENPDRNREFGAMAGFLGSLETVHTTALNEYVGYADGRPLYVHDLTGPSDADWEAALAVYTRAFGNSPTAVPGSEFELQTIARTGSREFYTYHLWALRTEETGPVHGMASFFAFPRAGFGGYVAFEGGLRGSRRLRLLVARIEERMLREFPESAGWYVECADERSAILLQQVGFREVELQYVQPNFHKGPTSPPPPKTLSLLYKPFGIPLHPVQISVGTFVEAMHAVFRFVYRLSQADIQRSVEALRAQIPAGRWIPLRPPETMMK